MGYAPVARRRACCQGMIADATASFGSALKCAADHRLPAAMIETIR